MWITSITLELPEEIRADLLRHAELAGLTPEDFVAEAVRRQLAQRQLQERHQLEDVAWVLSLHQQRQ